MSALLRGKACLKGQTIGIIALSAPCIQLRFEQGINSLRNMGYNCKVALDPSKYYGRHDYLFSSDSAQARAKALEQQFLDPEIAAILLARGAYGAMEVLPLIDFEILRNSPKTIIGFSDGSCILLALWARLGLVGIHGPSLESSFSRLPDDKLALQSASQLLEYIEGAAINPFKDMQLQYWTGSGGAEGRLVGGNLSALVSMLATPWEVDLDSCLLFLEEVNEKPYRIHRMLMQLKLSSKLDKLAGVILGDFKNCVHNERKGPQLQEVIQDVFADYDYPVVGTLPFGHGSLNLPMPIGIKARLAENRLELLESPVLKS